MFASIDQLLPLASTAESALFFPEPPTRTEDVPPQGARVRPFLQIGALGGDVFEAVVLDQHPLGVVALDLALHRVGARVLRPVRVGRADVHAFAVLGAVAAGVMDERVAQHTIAGATAEVDASSPMS